MVKVKKSIEDILSQHQSSWEEARNAVPDQGGKDDSKEIVNSLGLGKGEDCTITAKVLSAKFVSTKNGSNNVVFKLQATRNKKIVGKIFSKWVSLDSFEIKNGERAGETVTVGEQLARLAVDLQMLGFITLGKDASEVSTILTDIGVEQPEMKLWLKWSGKYLNAQFNGLVDDEEATDVEDEVADYNESDDVYEGDGDTVVEFPEKNEIVSFDYENDTEDWIIVTVNTTNETVTLKRQSDDKKLAKVPWTAIGY